MTVQVRTPVRIKARPTTLAYIYGSLKDRADAGMHDVIVYFSLPHGAMQRNVYAIEEIEEVDQ